MKNTLKLFGLLMVSIVVFSCSTDDHDTELEQAIKLSESINQTHARAAGETQSDSITKEDGNPLIIIIKKD